MSFTPSLSPPLTIRLPLNFEAFPTEEMTKEESSSEIDPLSPPIFLKNTLLTDVHKEPPHESLMSSEQFRKFCFLKKITKFNHFYRETILKAQLHIGELLSKRGKKSRVPEKIFSSQTDALVYKGLKLLEKLKNDPISISEMSEMLFQELKKCPILYKKEEIDEIRHCFFSSLKSNDVIKTFPEDISLTTLHKTRHGYSKLYWCTRVFFSIIGIKSAFGYAIMLFNEAVDNGIIKSDAPIQIIKAYFSSRSNHQYEQTLLSILKSDNDIKKEEMVKNICDIFSVNHYLEDDDEADIVFTEMMERYYELGFF